MTFTFDPLGLTPEQVDALVRVGGVARKGTFTGGGQGVPEPRSVAPDLSRQLGIPFRGTPTRESLGVPESRSVSPDLSRQLAKPVTGEATGLTYGPYHFSPAYGPGETLQRGGGMGDGTGGGGTGGGSLTQALASERPASELRVRPAVAPTFAGPSLESIQELIARLGTGQGLGATRGGDFNVSPGDGSGSSGDVTEGAPSFGMTEGLGSGNIGLLGHLGLGAIPGGSLITALLALSKFADKMGLEGNPDEGLAAALSQGQLEAMGFANLSGLIAGANSLGISPNTFAAMNLAAPFGRAGLDAATLEAAPTRGESQTLSDTLRGADPQDAVPQGVVPQGLDMTDALSGPPATTNQGENDTQGSFGEGVPGTDGDGIGTGGLGTGEGEGLHKGGLVKRGPPRGPERRATLLEKEYVVKAKAVKLHRGLLEAINRGAPKAELRRLVEMGR